MKITTKAFASTRHRGKSRRNKAPLHRTFAAAVISDRTRFIVFAGFILLVALTGGGSRPDIQSLLILRPAAVLFSAYALFTITMGQLREVRAPLLIVASLMLLALLQLLPLPAAIWTDLPGREVVTEAGVLVGMDELQRPLSLDPNRTWNTFFALFVSLAAIGLAAIQAPAWRRLIIPMLVGVALLSAIVGFLQAITGNNLQFYSVSHRGFPTGLFANKNHQSVMLLWLMIGGCWLAAMADPRRLSPKSAMFGALATILVLFPLLILTGSRAGLMLALPALLLCGWLLLRAPAAREILRRASGGTRVIVAAVGVLMIAAILFVLGVVASSDRQSSLSRLFQGNAAGDLRWQYLSIFQQMALDFLPFGSGFGSFESTFNIYEPADMLTAHYMNQAHNDAIQLVIEGGLPAVAILVAALAWFTLRIWRMWRSSLPEHGRLALFLGGSIALWLAASLVDYPLRTPLASLLIATLTAQLAMLSSGHRAGGTGR